MPTATLYDLIVFDYDGTLCDTRLAIAQSIARAFDKFGRPVPARQRRLSVVGQGLSLRDTCLQLDAGLREHPAALDEIVQSYRAFYRDEGEPLIRMFAGVGDTLQRLCTLGLKCIVVSNKGFEAVQRSLDRHQLTPLVAAVFAERPGVPGKPDPALLTDHIIPQFPQIAGERMLMVGDTEADIAFATAAGIACCWAAYGFGDQARCRALRPQYEISAIAQLPDVIAPAKARTEARR